MLAACFSFSSLIIGIWAAAWDDARIADKMQSFSSLIIGIWAAAEKAIMGPLLSYQTFSSLIIGIWAAANRVRMEGRVVVSFSSLIIGIWAAAAKTVNTYAYIIAFFQFPHHRDLGCSPTTTKESPDFSHLSVPSS